MENNQSTFSKIKLYLLRLVKKNYKKGPLILLALGCFIFNIYLSKYSFTALNSRDKLAALRLFIICLLLILVIFSYINYNAKKSTLMLVILSLVMIVLLALLSVHLVDYLKEINYLNPELKKPNISETTLKYSTYLKESLVVLIITIIMEVAAVVSAVILEVKHKKKINEKRQKLN